MAGATTGDGDKVCSVAEVTRTVARLKVLKIKEVETCLLPASPRG